MPEPQNGPYWILQKQGSIRKCHGCKEGLDGEILGRYELDYFPKVYDDASKCWLVSTSAHYYHIDIDCLKRRRPNCKLTFADLRFMEGVSMSNEMKCKLLIDS